MIEWGRTLFTAGSRTIGVGSQSARCWAVVLVCGGGEGEEEEEEKKGEAKTKQIRSGQVRAGQGREGIVVCDTTSYVIVMGADRDRQHRTELHGTVQYSTVQHRERTCEKERGREIKAHQGRVKLDCKKKSKPPTRMQWRADGGGGAGRVKFDVVEK